MILRDKNKTQETGNKKAREQDQAFSVTKMSHFGALFLPQVSSDKGLATGDSAILRQDHQITPYRFFKNMKSANQYFYFLVIW